MSLTSELARPGSPIRTHIRDRFPNTSRIVQVGENGNCRRRYS